MMNERFVYGLERLTPSVATSSDYCDKIGEIVETHNVWDTVSEWLRRWTGNPLGSARVGSNPTGVVFQQGLQTLMRVMVILLIF